MHVFLEQRRRQVAFAEVREDDDDVLAGVFRTRCNLFGCCQGGPCADAHQRAVFACHAACGFECFFVADGLNFVVELSVEDFGNEVSSDALNGVRACLAFRQKRRSFRFDGNDLDVRIGFAQRASGTRDGAAGADSRNEDVDRASVFEDFFAGGGVVLFGVGLVGKL